MHARGRLTCISTVQHQSPHGDLSALAQKIKNGITLSESRKQLICFHDSERVIPFLIFVFCANADKSQRSSHEH
jgi:hypothetical protein